MAVRQARVGSAGIARGRILTGLVLTLFAILLPACSKSSSTFRYRLTFAVEVDGEIKSASSIIEVFYYGYGGQVGASGARAYSYNKGVAPVIDLGSRGMLFASMIVSDLSEWSQRRKKFDLVCKQPVSAASLPGVYGLHALDLDGLRNGDKRNLTEDGYPAFVWFPDGAPWQDAKQLCPEEFDSLIGGVTLKSVSIEPAWKAPLLTRLAIQAPWLDQLRKDQEGKGRFKKRDQFSLALDALEWAGPGIKHD